MFHERSDVAHEVALRPLIVALGAVVSVKLVAEGGSKPAQDWFEKGINFNEALVKGR